MCAIEQEFIKAATGVLVIGAMGGGTIIVCYAGLVKLGLLESPLRSDDSGMKDPSSMKNLQS
jgi:hypothetical protein